VICREFAAPPPAGGGDRPCRLRDHLRHGVRRLFLRADLRSHELLPDGVPERAPVQRVQFRRRRLALLAPAKARAGGRACRRVKGQARQNKVVRPATVATSAHRAIPDAAPQRFFARIHALRFCAQATKGNRDCACRWQVLGSWHALEPGRKEMLKGTMKLTSLVVFAAVVAAPAEAGIFYQSIPDLTVAPNLPEGSCSTCSGHGSRWTGEVFSCPRRRP
jgi:hypothetical protein